MKEEEESMEMPTESATTTDALELSLNKVFEAPDKKTWEELDNTNIDSEIDVLLAINDSDDQRSFEEKLEVELKRPLTITLHGLA